MNRKKKLHKLETRKTTVFSTPLATLHLLHTFSLPHPTTNFSYSHCGTNQKIVTNVYELFHCLIACMHIEKLKLSFGQAFYSCFSTWDLSHWHIICNWFVVIEHRKQFQMASNNMYVLFVYQCLFQTAAHIIFCSYYLKKCSCDTVSNRIYLHT